MIYINKPFLVVVIGYILGILWGLYFKSCIILFYIPIIVTKLVFKQIKRKNLEFKLFSCRRYFRYLKLIFSIKIIYIFIISSIISNMIILILNQKYENIFQDGEKVFQKAVVVSLKEEKEYKVSYKVKIKGFYAYLYIDKNKNFELNIGDYIQIEGIYQKPEKIRNEGGFNQDLFYRTKKICGIIQGEKIRLINNSKEIFIEDIRQKLCNQIYKKINFLLDKNKSALLKGLLLGDTSQIEENQKENFRISNIAHILAISGMHITYIIIGTQYILLKIIGKNKTRLVLIVFLLIYACITGFTPSVLRAIFMVVLFNISKLLYRKNNIINSLSFSLLIILLDNPYSIMNIGLQLSYIGTIGILFFHSIFKNLFQIEKTKAKYKKIRIQDNFIIKKLLEILATIFSAQIVILPISIFYFNSFSMYSIFSNILVSIFIGPVIIIGFIMVIVSFVFIPFAKILSVFLNLGLDIILGISKMSNLPFANFYFPTPNIWFIIIYYYIIFFIGKIYMLYKEESTNMTQNRIKNIFAMLKMHIRCNLKIYKNVSILVILFLIIFFKLPRKLEIHFVDVGQGDCTFIETPLHKTILIDGGGSESSNYDVGKNILLPYILDKGYNKIDYVFISHLDQDHVGRIINCNARNKN